MKEMREKEVAEVVWKTDQICSFQKLEMYKIESDVQSRLILQNDYKLRNEVKLKLNKN